MIHQAASKRPSNRKRIASCWKAGINGHKAHDSPEILGTGAKSDGWNIFSKHICWDIKWFAFSLPLWHENTWTKNASKPLWPREKLWINLANHLFQIGKPDSDPHVLEAGFPWTPWTLHDILWIKKTRFQMLPASNKHERRFHSSKRTQFIYWLVHKGLKITAYQ